MDMNEYLSEMWNACTSNWSNLFDKDCLYYGPAGHKRLAREMGYAIKEIASDSKEVLNVAKSTYSSFYVRLMNLKPEIDAKDWISEIKVVR